MSNSSKMTKFKRTRECEGDLKEKYLSTWQNFMVANLTCKSLEGEVM
jgi:hypothetical protein